jgi:chemotaxis protein methyltransferase CheR
MKPTPRDLDAVCRLADRLCGIQWDQSKAYLVESRLLRLLPEFGCADYVELARLAATDARVQTAFVDAVTTRETLFFRDESPFRALEHKVLPELVDRRAGTSHARRLRLWSAACSSGQEAYSLAITLLRTLPNVDAWDVQILATDVSDAAVAQASRGVYSDFEVGRGLDAATRERYFERKADRWQVRDEVRSLVRFARRNLLEPFHGLGLFDVVFCRNVAIYFDLPVKRDLLERLAGVLAVDGAIFVGSAESLSGFGPRWRPQLHCGAVFYQPNLSLSRV